MGKHGTTRPTLSPTGGSVTLIYESEESLINTCATFVLSSWPHWRLPNTPPPRLKKNKILSHLHWSHRWPISVSKWYNLPKGEEFAYQNTACLKHSSCERVRLIYFSRTFDFSHTQTTDFINTVCTGRLINKSNKIPNILVVGWHAVNVF